MVRPLVALAFFSFLAFGNAIAQSSSTQPDPALTGYITRSVSLSDFDVNGLHVVSNPKTQIMHGSVNARSEGGDVFFGEKVSIFGEIDHKKHFIKATEIIFLRPEPRTLSGIAVIDRVLKPANKGELLLRADGYVIRINSSTKTTFIAPLSTLSDVQPNTWITYHGALNPDGLFTADTAAFKPNNISDRENKLLQRTDYDPAEVPSNSKQSAASKFIFGWDPKKVPPYDDPAMQERVTRIGTSLVPAFQRSLPPHDFTKILFQFQVIDHPKLHDAFVLPSGVVLVPHQVVERLQNDSQIAAVLADNIAIALEKQGYRLDPAMTTMSAVSTATTIGGFFVPGLGLAGLAMYPSAKSIQNDLLDQSGRVSLGLLRDAGYDIQQAPIAWWLLASKPKKTLAETAVPPRAINLYRTIGLIWKNYPDSIPAIPQQQQTQSLTNISSQ